MSLGHEEEMRAVGDFLLPSNPFFLYISFVLFLPLGDFFYTSFVVRPPVKLLHPIYGTDPFCDSLDAWSLPSLVQPSLTIQATQFDNTDKEVVDQNSLLSSAPGVYLSGPCDGVLLIHLLFSCRQWSAYRKHDLSPQKLFSCRCNGNVFSPAKCFLK